MSPPSHSPATARLLNRVSCLFSVMIVSFLPSTTIAFVLPVLPHHTNRIIQQPQQESAITHCCQRQLRFNSKAIHHYNHNRAGANGRSHRVSMAAAAAAAVDLSGDGGVVREVVREGSGKVLGKGDMAMLQYTAMVSETGEVFAKGDQYRSTIGDGTMISGWDIGLTGLKVGDRAKWRVTSRYGYGDEGVTPVIPPNSSLEFEVDVLQWEGNIMNPATFADAAPLTPRTPETIKAAFERRQLLKAEQEGEKKEGIEGFIQWAKTIYIFGLFEGQTGQEAPWYLKPIITFPLMFAVTYIAFAGVLLLNGLSTSREVKVLDDVDVAMGVVNAMGEIFRA